MASRSRMSGVISGSDSTLSPWETRLGRASPAPRHRARAFANYQLSGSHRSLLRVGEKQGLSDLVSITESHLTEFLASRKREGLAASSLRLHVIALKIFFRFQVARGISLVIPRPDCWLPGWSPTSRRPSNAPDHEATP
ncbi:MAG: site-specific integrase [Verrucomicrobiales bacterium]